MSGGGSSSGAQYPAQALAGLWQGYNNAFSFNPGQAASTGWPGAYSDTANLTTSPTAYGYNPQQYVTGGSQLATAGQQAFDQANIAGNSIYSALTNQMNPTINAGNKIYGQLSGWAPGVAQGGQGLFNSLTNPQMLASAVAPGMNVASQLQPYLGQAIAQGFDPQQALYQKLFTEQQNQAAASNAAAGVATTPYGAGLAQQGNQNFDIAWQQAQLANQAQAANTAATLGGAITGGVGSGINNLTNLANAGMGALTGGYGTAGALDTQGINSLLGAEGTAGTLGTNALSGLLNAYSSGLGDWGNALNTGSNLGQSQINFGNNLLQNQIQDYLNLINSSNNAAAQWAGATTGAFGAANQLYGTQVGQNLGLQQLLGQSLGGLGSLGGNLLGYFLS